MTPTNEPTTAQVDAALKLAEIFAKHPAHPLAGKQMSTVQTLAAEVRRLRADLLSWQGNCQRMADQHGDISRELGEAEARNARLVTALYKTGSNLHEITCYAENEKTMAIAHALTEEINAVLTAKAGAQVPDAAELAREKAKGATSRNASDYTPAGHRFFDARSGREMLLATDGPFAGWLCYRHPDGPWVSLRVATEQDRAAVDAAMGGAGK